MTKNIFVNSRFHEFTSKLVTPPRVSSQNNIEYIPKTYIYKTFVKKARRFSCGRMLHLMQ